MKIRYLLATCLICAVVGGPAIGQSPIPLTPEQQRMLNMLPPIQREAAIRQLQMYARQRQQVNGQAQPMTREPSRGDLIDSQAPVDQILAELGERDTIKPDDTLVVEIAFPKFPDDAPAEMMLTPREHLLEGLHVAQLDRNGTLSLPGITGIRLAGLKPRQAELRLKAIASLRDMEIKVERLTLEPVGREALKPFGTDIFARDRDRQESLGYGYQARRQMPVPGDYVVGPGDRVRLFVHGKESGQYDLDVTPDGQLLVPNLGPIGVAGLKYSEMKALVEGRIRNQTIGVQATLTISELRSIEVMIVGDVKRPGIHVIDALGTIITALDAAEGPTEVGSLRSIKVLRGGEVFTTADLYQLLLEGKARADLRLEGGDIIFVPPVQARIGVMGEVQRPAWYEITGPTAVGEVIAMAGGLGLGAAPNAIQIERLDETGQLEILDASAGDGPGLQTEVAPGDVVVVAVSPRIPRNAVSLRGHFTLPGNREWRPDLTLADLMPGPNVLKENPDLDYALIVRERADGAGVHIIEFAPREVFTQIGTASSLKLHRRDEILTFGFDDLRGRRALVNPLVTRLTRQAGKGREAAVVRITGAVRAPGSYPVSAGMQLGDLIRAGGGLDESAYLESAEITRFEVADGQIRRTEHLSVALDSIVNGDPVADLELQPHDVLNIKRIPAWTDRGTVTLRGEVRFPGTYPIRSGEMLSTVIERAGGLTDLAFPRAAVFTRETLRRREQEQIDNMIKRLEADVAAAALVGNEGAAQARSMATTLIEQLKSTRAAGRLVIDLNALIASPGDENLDITTHDGDLLVIPQRPQEITVLGEVYFPTSHVYDPDLTGEDYLSRSGGLTFRADDKRVYVVRANGAVETMRKSGFSRRAPAMRPGDTIVVPIDAERVPPMVRLTNISQIVYQLGVAAAAWNTIGVF